MKKTIRDILYNGLYQVVILIIPFMTQPYLYRVMQDKAMGINALVNSLPTMLCVLIMFGMNQFGVKTIAQTGREERTAVFGKLWGIQLLVGTVVLFIYTLCALLFLNYKFLYLLEIPFLIGYIIDISWFFIGIGEIRKVIVRNTAIKLLIVASVFLFVHKPGDLWIYILINSVTYLANFVFWPGLQHHLGQKLTWKTVAFSKKYFVPALVVTLPTVAVQLYISFDQQLVGRLSSVMQLNYYAYPQGLIRSIIAIAGSISTVLMPKMAEMIISKNESQVIKLLKKSLDFTLIVSLYLMIVVMLDASKFSSWFWNAGNYQLGLNLKIGSIIIVFVSYGGVLANQFTLAKGMFRSYSLPYYVGAIVSLSLNCLIIPRNGAIGATSVIVFTEFVVLFMRVYLVRSIVNLSYLFKNQWTVVVSALGALSLAASLPVNSGFLFIDLVIQTGVISVAFMGLLFVFRNEFIWNLYRKVRHS